MTVPNRSTKKGAIITGLVTLFGIVAVIVAFISNASPYGTFADARKTHNDSVHVAGDLVKNSISADLQANTISFGLKDQNGEAMTVVYSGPPPANLAEATKIVAIGGVKDGVFKSDRLLVKCPSKYEGQNKLAANN